MIAAAISIQEATTPPKTVPRALVSGGSTICVMSVSESAIGVDEK